MESPCKSTDELFNTGMDCPNDIHGFKYILENKENISQESCIRWLNVLLKLPFSLSHILTPGEVLDLKNVLYRHIKTEKVHHKLSIKNMALFVHNILINICEDSIMEYLKGNDNSGNASSSNLCLFGLSFDITEYYGLVNQLSKLFPKITSFLEIPGISELDSTTVARYKIKIMANTSTFCNAEGNINYFMKFINYRDYRFGWTLSKAICRVSRFCCRNSLSEQIKGSLKCEIIGNEQRWMNLLSVLSLLTLSGLNIGSMGDICLKALSYSRDHEPRAESLRETALFFLWGCVRLELHPSKDEMILVIWTALFDVSYRCRRAASAVLQEYLGRFSFILEHRRNLTEATLSKNFSQIMLFAPSTTSCKTLAQAPEHSHNIPPSPLIEKFCIISEKIISRNLRRLYDSFEVFLELPLHDLFKPHVLSLLSSTLFERRIIAAAITSFLYDPSEVLHDYLSVALNGYHLLIYFCNLFSCSSSPIYDTKELRLQNYIHSRHFDVLALTYLKIYEFVELQSLKCNIRFLVEKNYRRTELMVPVILRLKDDSSFMNDLFSMARRNEAGLAINIANHAHWDQLKKIYINNLKSLNKVSETLRAMQLSDFGRDKWTETDLEALLPMLYKFLDDYSLGSAGDAGYFSRKEAFLLLWKLKERINVEKYTIRFLADKSKKLRDLLANVLLPGYFSEEAVVETGKEELLLRNIEEIVRVRHPDMPEPKHACRAYCSSGNNHSNKQNDKQTCCRNTLQTFLSGELYDSLKQFLVYRNEYYRSYKPSQEQMQPRDADEFHFAALFKVFGQSQNKHFMTGVINTMASADSRLFEFLKQLTAPLAISYYENACNMIFDGSAFLLSSMKFLIRTSGRPQALEEALHRISVDKMNRTELRAFKILVAMHK